MGTDHQTLRHLLTQKSSTRRHNGWINALQPYSSYLKILYKKGPPNEADALSRRPDLMEPSQDALDSLLKTEAPLDQNSKTTQNIKPNQITQQHSLDLPLHPQFAHN